MYGYMGHILFIDLGRGTTEILPLMPKDARAWLGGGGLGAHLLYPLMPPHTPPLAEASVLGFISGALNASGALLAGRYAVVCKSPLTNSWHQTSTGGDFGAKLRGAGYDAVLIGGSAAHPVYIRIDEGRAEILDASHLWGQTVPQAAATLEAEMGRDCYYSLIGPAGERHRRSACIINNSGSAAGGGCGAVMGVKNLKALVLQGNKQVPLADPGAISEMNRRIIGDLQDNGGDFQPKRYACFACPFSCGSYARATDKPPMEKPKPRPKHGTSLAFDSLFSERDREAVRLYNDLCDAYGLDTIAVAGSIAWLLRCAQAGLFTAVELGGKDLSMDKEAIIDLTRLIATGQGIGAILAEGADYAAAHFDRGQQFLPQAAPPKNIDSAELAAWLTTAKNKTALSLEDGAGKTIKSVLRDACGFCKFDTFHLPAETWLAYLNAATGWGMDEMEFTQAGARLAQMRQAFDLQQDGEERAAAELLAGVFAAPQAGGGKR